MSSTLRPQASQPNLYHHHDLKTRKVDRACDACRRRKTKCDGPRMPHNICSNCLQTRKHCAYVEASKPRGPPKAYVTGLEVRLERMEALLKRLRPNVDLTEELGPPIIRDSWKTDSFGSGHRQLRHSLSLGRLPIPRSDINENSADSAPTSIGISTHLSLNNWSQRRTHSKGAGTLHTPYSSSESSYASSSDELVETSAQANRHLTGEVGVADLDYNQRRFHGHSPYKLVEVTRKFKEQHFRSGTGWDENFNPGSGRASAEGKKRKTQLRRPEFWTTPSWEVAWEGLHHSSQRFLPSILANFPPEDLVLNLIELYFIHVNAIYPLLHRPTFEQQWRSGLHYRSIWFAGLCLSVFAVTSRWCNDPRVIPDKVSDRPETEPHADHGWRSAGLTYFETAVGIHRIRRSLMLPTCLFEVQTFTLLAMFHRGNGSQHIAWMFVGVGIRKAMDVGAHRKRVYRKLHITDQELWKRAFLLLVAFDRIDSAYLGRSCLVGEEDYDLDFPLEVDDDYWETEGSSESMACRQPSGKPASVTSFTWWLKLTRITAFAMRTIYAVDKRKVLFGVVITRWREEVVMQLSKGMEQWLTSLPQHLRWSNQINDTLFAQQSAVLHLTYYSVQTLIYQLFIPPPTGLSPYVSGDFPFPALEICVDAAKSCAEIVNRQMRSEVCYVPLVVHASQACAGLLLMIIWNLKAREKVVSTEQLEDIKPSPAGDVEGLMNDVSLFLRALEWAGPRWGDAAVALKRLRESLPSSDCDSSSPTSSSTQYLMNDCRHSASDSPRSVYSPASCHLNLDESLDHQIHNTNGWHWYSASQLPVAPCTAVSNSPQHQYHWQKQHSSHTFSEEQRGNSTRPIIFPVQDDLSSSYPSSHRSRTNIVPHMTEWPTPPTSSMPRPSASGGHSGNFSDRCTNSEKKLNVTRDINIDSVQPMALHPIVHRPDMHFPPEPRVLENISAAAWDKVTTTKSIDWAETLVPSCVVHETTGPNETGSANVYSDCHY